MKKIYVFLFVKLLLILMVVGCDNGNTEKVVNHPAEYSSIDVNGELSYKGKAIIDKKDLMIEELNQRLSQEPRLSLKETNSKDEYVTYKKMGIF